jgi:hypothetical protein
MNYVTNVFLQRPNINRNNYTYVLIHYNIHSAVYKPAIVDILMATNKM